MRMLLDLKRDEGTGLMGMAETHFYTTLDSFTEDRQYHMRLPFIEFVIFICHTL